MMRSNPVKATLRSGGTTIGTWLSLASPIAARFLARAGLDWVTLDLEHSPVGLETAATIYAHVADAGGVPLARVPSGSHDHIKQTLDSGAFGVVVPMVMDRRQAEMCVAACRYPPIGNRSVGGMLHAVNFAAPPDLYYSRANDEVLIVLQCEHISAVERADEIFSVQGIDAIFVGPNDLRASMRSPSGAEPTSAAYEAALERILRVCKGNRIAAGIHCFSAEEVRRRRDEGWRFLALGSDLSLLMTGLRQEVEKLDRSMDDLAKY